MSIATIDINLSIIRDIFIIVVLKALLVFIEREGA